MFNAQKLAASLRGGRQPRDVALAVVLGLLAGFVTGWNLTLAAVLLAVVLFNARTRTFLAAWAAGLAGAWLLGGVTHWLGELLLDSTPLGQGVAALGDGAWIALLDWDRYTLVGGACLALPLSLTAARLAARLARSPSGVDAETSPWLRPLGAVGAAGVFLATAVATSQLVSARVERELLAQLTEANGAPVTAGEFHFSLWSGNLHISDLQLADPRRLDRDRLRIGRVTAQLSAGDLVRGRLCVDTLLLEHLRGDVARRQPAESNEFAPPVIEIPSFDETASAMTIDTIELDGYLRNWAALRDRLAVCEPWVKGLGSLAACDQNTVTVRRQRSDLGQPRPRVFIARLHAAGLASSWGLGARATLDVTRLSSRPASLDDPTRIELVAPECGTEISAELDPHDETRRIAISLRSHGLSLDELVDPHQTMGLFDIADGAVRLAGEGWIDGSQLELPLHVEIESLDAHVTGRQSLAGISAAVWDDGLRRLGALRADVLLSGTWDSPTLSADRKRVVEQFKHQLRAAGEHQLVKAIEEQLARAGAASAKLVDSIEVPTPADEDVCRISDQSDAPLPRYAYPSTDDDFVDGGPIPPPTTNDQGPASPRRPLIDHGPDARAPSKDLVPSDPAQGGVTQEEACPAPGSTVPAATSPGEPVAPPAAAPSEPTVNETISLLPGEAAADKSAMLDTSVPDVGHGAGGGASKALEPRDDEQQREPSLRPAPDGTAEATAAVAAPRAEGATARPSVARWRARRAVADKPAPAPSWTPQTEPAESALVKPTGAQLPAHGDLQFGRDDESQTKTAPSRRGPFVPVVRADNESHEPAEPEKPESLLTRWSKGVRSTFGRMWPHRHGEEVDSSGTPDDFVEPPDEVGADDGPTIDDAPSAHTEAKRPWYKIFRR